MNNTNEVNIVNQSDDEMRDEYGPEFFARAERGKFYRLQLEALRQKVENAAQLAPDVRAAFPTDEAVNEALRRLMHQSEATKQAETVSVPVSV